MDISSRFGLTILFLVLLSPSQTHLVFGNPNPNLLSRPTIKFPLSAEPDPEPQLPIELTKCPDPSESFQCYCSDLQWQGLNIRCTGPKVNQTTIENAFRELRRVNGISEGGPIQTYIFEVGSTELTHLDLAPFYGQHIEELQIRRNANLTQLVTSGDLEDHGSIHVKHLNIQYLPLLQRDGFGDALKYFSNELTQFSAWDLDFSEYNDSFQGEFLSGLSLHTNLTKLTIYDCNISAWLTSDTLIPKGLQNLRFISLRYNEIEIGENFFDFENGRDLLEIFLPDTKISESGFHPNSGIAKIGRRTTLSLVYNQMSTLPALIFESFLDAHPQNSLDLFENPLICDERLSWIKSRREEFQSRVTDADCSNDKGHTVFDSNLIP